jgi:hypothetical protein
MMRLMTSCRPYRWSCSRCRCCRWSRPSLSCYRYSVGCWVVGPAVYRWPGHLRCLLLLEEHRVGSAGATASTMIGRCHHHRPVVPIRCLLLHLLLLHLVLPAAGVPQRAAAAHRACQ